MSLFSVWSCMNTSVNKSTTFPSLRSSNSGLAKFLGNTPFRVLLLFSITTITLSMTLPITGVGGTMLEPVYKLLISKEKPSNLISVMLFIDSYPDQQRIWINERGEIKE